MLGNECEHLWQRVLMALDLRGALPEGTLTAIEIAREADQALKTDLIGRFVNDCYIPVRYGSAIVSGEEAERLVSLIEALPTAAERSLARGTSAASATQMEAGAPVFSPPHDDRVALAQRGSGAAQDYGIRSPVKSRRPLWAWVLALCFVAAGAVGAFRTGLIKWQGSHGVGETWLCSVAPELESTPKNAILTLNLAENTAELQLPALDYSQDFGGKSVPSVTIGPTEVKRSGMRLRWSDKDLSLDFVSPYLMITDNRAKLPKYGPFNPMWRPEITGYKAYLDMWTCRHQDAVR